MRIVLNPAPSLCLLQFFKVRHLPRRTASVTKTWGARLLQLPVRVHRGFYRAWMGHDYDQRIMGRIRALLDDMPPETRIYVTGHSLGGALATLCAHAIRTAFPSYPLTVYTYGEPRVGNHAFAHEYNAMVPEHFAVINDQDPVTRVPFGSYKRVGDRILINDLGDIAVRPSFLEMQVINSAGEVGDHFLEFYRQSIMRVIHSQFTDRHIRNGREGAAALAEELDLQKSLMCVNVDLASLEDPEKEPVTVEEAARRSSMKLSRKRSFGCGNGGMACGCGTEKVLKRTERAGNDEAHEKVTKVEKGQV